MECKTEIEEHCLSCEFDEQ